MRKNKILITIIIALQMFAIKDLSPFSFKSKVFDKVKKSIKETTKQTKESFERFFKEKSHDISESKGFQSLKDAAITTENSIKAGIDILINTLNKKLKKIDSVISNLVWNNQCDFIEELNKIYLQSKNDSRKFLYAKLTQQYQTEKTPAIIFATDLEKEKNTIEEYILQLNEYIKNKNEIDNKNDLIHLERTFTNLIKAQKNIEKLMEVFNNLLN